MGWGGGRQRCCFSVARRVCFLGLGRMNGRDSGGTLLGRDLQIDRRGCGLFG